MGARGLFGATLGFVVGLVGVVEFSLFFRGLRRAVFWCVFVFLFLRVLRCCCWWCRQRCVVPAHAQPRIPLYVCAQGSCKDVGIRQHRRFEVYALLPLSMRIDYDNNATYLLMI